MRTPNHTALLRRLTARNRPKPVRGPAATALAALLRLGSAALLGWIGYVHLHLWLEGYRQIPTDGPFFLLDALVAFGFAGLIVAWPRPLAGLAAAGFVASTIGALLVSLTVGLFGFHESWSASFVPASLVVESVAVLSLLFWTALVIAPAPSGPHGAREPVPIHRPS